MDRRITRRDILHGAGALAAMSLLPGKLPANQVPALKSDPSRAYPPALSGLRGSHVGSFEAAHELAREGRRDWGPVVESDSSDYDLVIVGAGISGLAAAHFYLKAHPKARLLILDNHDDFGGHAKRNEFRVGEHQLIGYGGSQTLEAPGNYAKATKTLLADLGIDLDYFYKAYDQGFFRRHGLGGAVFFDRANWGVDRLVHYDLGGLGYTLPLARRRGSTKAAVAEMPMPEPARDQMLGLLTSSADVFPGLTVNERLEILGSISYRDYLSEYLGIREPQVFAALQPLSTDLGADIGAVPAIDALYYVGLPGYEASGLPDWDDEEPYIHHFPDGNAAITRMLVRRLIPDAASGSTLQDIVLADFDYGKLDVDGAPVRLRLNSTAVNVRHDGRPESANPVRIDYVRHGRHGQVRARHCVLACYNAIIPFLCPDMPEQQRQALSTSLKTAVLYTNVALNNWRALEGVRRWRSLGARQLPRQRHARFPGRYGRLRVFQRNPATRSSCTWSASRTGRTRVSPSANRRRWGAMKCWRHLSRPSSAIHASSLRQCLRTLDSIRRAISRPSRSTAGRTATRRGTGSRTITTTTTTTRGTGTCGDGNASGESSSPIPMPAPRLPSTWPFSKPTVPWRNSAETRNSQKPTRRTPGTTSK